MQPPENFIDPLILPLICVMLSLLLRLGAWGRERSGGKTTAMKFISYLPALFGVYVGARYVWVLHEPELGFMYQRALEGRKKILVAHYAAALIPLVTLIGIAVWGRIERRLGRPIAI